MAELSTVLAQEVNTVLRLVLLLYTDGGPDHRTTYVSVQAALLALFLKHKLDYLVAARTAPMNSYRNPAEQAMALLNLALQCGVMCQPMADHFDQATKSANSMKDMRMQVIETQY